MPEGEIAEEYTSKEPYSAEILVRQESYDVTRMQSNGYASKVIHVDGGILLKISISASTLEELQMKINGHVSLI